MNLRDYQSDCHDSVLNQWKEVNSTLAVLPTGAGKTICFAAIIQSCQPKRALVLAHRSELITQARDKIQRFSGLECQIEMAELRADNSLFGRAPVVISTIQTQNATSGERKRMGQFDPKEFGILIADEAHHFCAPSFREVLEYYRRGNPDIKICGFTATPDRHDEKALGQIFETVAFDYEILDAIEDGWLVPVEQQMVHIHGLDFSHIRTTAGDLNGADLQAVMEAESNMQGVAGSLIEILGDRKTLVFTVGVKQAEVLCNIFNRHRAGMAAWVCDKTRKDERREIVKDFADGKYQVVCNCDIFGEGFDDPGVQVVAMAKPTLSRAKYSQMAGRCMRPLSGIVDGPLEAEQRRAAISASAKPSCLLVDFAGNSGRHKLMTSADILGGNVSDEAIENARRWAEELGKKKQAVMMVEVLEEQERKWQDELKRRRQEEEARKAKLVAKVKYTTTQVSPFDAFGISPVKERGWNDGKRFSEKQAGFLRKMGVDPEKIPYGQGQQLIGEQIRRYKNNLATAKQCALLKRFGYETKDLKMADASRLIDGLKNNGWKRVDTAQAVA